jgi:hypothetical protein
MALRTLPQLLFCGLEGCARVLAAALLKALLAFALILLVLSTSRAGDSIPSVSAQERKDIAHSFAVSSTSDKTTKREPAVSIRNGDHDKQASRIFADGFEPEEEGGPVPFSCDHPSVKPAWMTGTQKTWSQMFSPPDGNPVPTYPDGLGFPVPIGANKGAWVAGKFVALPNQTTNLYWELAQAKPNEGYDRARPAYGMSISVSPCAGDLRGPVFGAIDFLAPGCRKHAFSASLVMTTKHPASTFAYCALVPGETYYITVSPVNFSDGLTPGEHTCTETPASADGCDVQAKFVAQ